MPAGRPTKYKPEYCEQIVEFCKDGFSITGFAGSIGVDRDSITEWAKVYPEFSLAVKEAKAAAGYWWEKQSITGAKGGNANPTLCIFGLKNMAREDWQDKADINLGGQKDNPIKSELSLDDKTIEAIASKANELKEQF